MVGTEASTQMIADMFWGPLRLPVSRLLTVRAFTFLSPMGLYLLSESIRESLRGLQAPPRIVVASLRFYIRRHSRLACGVAFRTLARLGGRLALPMLFQCSRNPNLFDQVLNGLRRFARKL